MTVLNTPQYRAVVQDGLLVSDFQESLFPELLFRAEATASDWGEQEGDSKIFTGDGPIPVTTAPVAPMAEPEVVDYDREQWVAQLHRWGKTKPTHVPTSVHAAMNLLIRDTKALGKHAGQTLNRIVRNRLYNACLSGHTVADGAQSGVTTLRVKRLNGFTRARRPDLTTGSPVRFDPVSVNNPLQIKVNQNTGSATSTTVVGFTPDFPNDEIGPGTLTLSAAVTVLDRASVVADTATAIRRAGGGYRVDEIGATDKLAFSDLYNAIARLSSMDVPRCADGYWHGHLTPNAKAQIFADPEFRQINESMPEGLAYSQFAFKRALGGIWFENNENPQAGLNVNIPNGSTDGATLDQYHPAREDFAGELYPSGTPTNAVGSIDRTLILGGGWIKEYYVDQDKYTTEAGTNARISEMPQVTDGAVKVMAERVLLIQLAPRDKWQEVVDQSWKFTGDFVARTDAATGDAAVYKRGIVIEHIKT